jgi:hypothetical protein
MEWWNDGGGPAFSVGRILLAAGFAALMLAAAGEAVPTVRLLTTSGEDATAFERGDTLVVEVVDASTAAESVAVTSTNVVRPDTLVIWVRMSSDTTFEGSLAPSWGTDETAELDVLPGDTIACHYAGTGGSAADSARARTHTAVLEIGAMDGGPGDPVSVLDSLIVEIHDRDWWLEDSVAVDLATSVERDSLWLMALGGSGDFRGTVGLVWGTGTEASALEVRGSDRIVAFFSDDQDTIGVPALVCDSVSVLTWNARSFWEDSLGIPVADYAPAATDSLRVRVEDRDLAGAASVEGEVVNRSDPGETERVVLVPSAVPDSVFRCSLSVQQPPATPENGIVEASNGDTLEFRYLEEADSSGSAAERIALVHYGGTAVAGGQTGTWAAADAPFLLSGDVTVPAGQTLTIEQGAVVKALPNQDALGSGIHETKVELVVYGALIAEGAGSDSVVLTSSSPSGGLGLWGGIRAEAGASLRMAHARVSGAAVGVAALGADVSLHNVALSRNGLESSGALYRREPPIPHRTVAALPGSLGAETACGLYLEGCSGDTVAGCVVGPTEGYGVFCVESSPVFTESSVHGSTLDGAVFYQSGGTIDLCRIRHNGQDGLYLLESAMMVSGCLVSDNGWAGLDAAFGADTVLCSGFVGNETRGILLYSEDGALVQDNSLVNNRVGVAVQGEQSPADLTRNSFVNNVEAGVRIAYGASPTVRCGNLYANGSYDLELGDYGWADVSADSNWWGRATTAAMESGADSIDTIWDWWDDPALGEVLFRPWLAGQEVRGPHEPDSTEIVALTLAAGAGDTILISVAIQGSSPDAGLLDYCTAEVWSDDDSLGIVVALPERDPVTWDLSSDGGWFGGWVVAGSDASSDAEDRLYVLPGGAVHGKVVVNPDVVDSLVWLSVDPPESVFPPQADIAFYPNPCFGSGTVVLNGVLPGDCELGLYDLLGRRVGRMWAVAGPDGRVRAPWTAPRGLRSGVYVWQSHGREARCRFVICR